MHIISEIFRRTLLQHIPIAVEGIGTVRTVRRRGRLLAGQRLEPPRRMPELVATGPEDVPLAEVVATELAVDSTTAYELCGEWVAEGARRARERRWPPGSFVFEGVGAVRGDAFLADAELLEMLNPLPAELLVVPTAVKHLPTASAQRMRQRGPRGKNPHHYTVSLLAILVVLVAVGYLAYYLWQHSEWLAKLLKF